MQIPAEILMESDHHIDTISWDMFNFAVFTPSESTMHRGMKRVYDTSIDSKWNLGRIVQEN